MEFFKKNISDNENDNLLKTRVELLDLHNRIKSILLEGGVRTLRGLSGRTESDLKEKFKLSSSDIDEINKSLRISLRIPLNSNEIRNPIFKSRTVTSDDKEIVKILAKNFNLDEKTLTGPGRHKETVFVRDLIIYLLREGQQLSFTTIGRMLGNRDHTTIIHSFKKTSDLLKNNEGLLSSYKFAIEKSKVDVGAFYKSLRKIKQKRSEVDQESSPSGVSIPKRDIEILNLYRKGVTLQKIASKSDLSRERIRQIVSKTIERISVNKSISTGVSINVNNAKNEEKIKRKNAIQKMKPQKTKLPYKRMGWSRYYEYCKSCKGTNFKHYKNGLCDECGNRSIMGEAREKMIFMHANKCDTCDVDRDASRKLHGRDFYLSRKNKTVLCRECFLHQMGKTLGDVRKNRWKKFYN